MIFYSISEVIVVTLESAKAEICGISKKYNLDMVLDVVAIPAPSMSGSISSQSEEFGTADAIRHIHDKLKANRIMIISSDLITDVQVLQISIFDLTTSETFSGIRSENETYLKYRY